MPAETTTVGTSIIGIIIFLILIVLALLAFIFWIWMLIDAIRRDFSKESEKIVWVLILLFTGILGALIYYLMVKRKG